MNGRSPQMPSPRFLTPTRNQQQYFVKQPLYLQPNSPSYLSPRGNRMSSPRNSSPDFIPLGVSSPVGRAKQNWDRRSNNSSYSSFGSPVSSNSSANCSPYRRNSSRGNLRGRGSFNNSRNGGTNSPNISHYIDKDVMEDPWSELEAKLKLRLPAAPVPRSEISEEMPNSPTAESDSESGSSGDTDES